MIALKTAKKIYVGMRVSIPDFSTKGELFSYLKTNKKEIISQKSQFKIESDPFDFGCSEIVAKSKDLIGKSVVKMTGQDTSLKEGEARVKVIANMHGYCDSYMDVLIKGSANKTIKDKGASNKHLLYHLKDHNHSTEGIVGGDVKAMVEMMDLKQFNVDSDVKKSEALLVQSTIKRKYDSKVYELYLDDEIKQHSIGLKYIKIYLCINDDDEEYVIEKENWDKYFPQVINKSKVENKGFFWAVTEYKLLENSCVLFGANELTTTQEIEKNEPSTTDTQILEPEAAKESTSLTELLTHLTKNDGKNSTGDGGRNQNNASLSN